MESILNDPQGVVKVYQHRWHGRLMPFVEVRAVDGRKLGFRWDPASSGFRFTGFREP